jgi:hypothetical protein
MATRPFEIKIKDADINAIRKTFKNMDEIAQNDMNRAAQAAPEVFQERMEDLHRFVAAGSRAAEAEDTELLRGYKES